MATTRTALTVRATELDAIIAGLATCYIRIYSGTLPATPETAVNGTLLAELRGNATFSAASTTSGNNKVLTANAITADASADAAGTAAYYRVLASDGTTVKWDGDCGVGTESMVLNSASISLGANVSCSALTLTLPM